MRFIFRVDAPIEFGAGHIMRNLGIVEELIDRGFEVYIIGNFNNLEWIEKKIRAIGVNLINSSDQDYALDNANDILILDSYTINVNDFFIQKSRWKFVVVIFDAHTPTYDCDLKIHPGPKTAWDDNPRYKILSGFEFIPFRKSLINANPLNYFDNRLRICVIGGGIDNNKFVYSISNILSKIQGDFTVSLFTNDTELETQDSRQKAIEIGGMFDGLINQFNLAFSTASTTCIELIAKGCAVGIARSSDNQDLNYVKLADLRVAAPIGFYEAGKWNLDIDMIKNLITFPTQRNQLINASKKIIDFEGASRIVDAILNL